MVDRLQPALALPRKLPGESLLESGNELGLVKYDAARHALQAARTVDEVKSIKNKAEAVRMYALQAHDAEMVNLATEIKVRAMRRLGELLSEMELKPGNPHHDKVNGRAPHTIKPTLAQMGIAKHESALTQKIAAVPEDEFEQAMRELHTAERISQSVIGPLIDNRSYRSTGEDNDEWYTPAKYIEAARSVLGKIDCDPASTKAANKIVKAATYWTADDDGLTKTWRGSVFLNPPNSRGLIAAFIGKLVKEIDAGRTTAAILVTHSSTETKWFIKAQAKATLIFFTDHRINFV